MNVGIITPRYPPNTQGGGEISVQLLAEHLSEDNRIDRVTVYTIDGDNVEVLNGVNVKRIGNDSHKFMELSNVKFASKIRNYLEPDVSILHAYNMELHPATGYISSKLDIPSIATLNSYRYFNKRNINVEPDLERRIYELIFLPTTGRGLIYYIHKIDAFTVLSKSSQKVYNENGFDNEWIEHIPNMVDPSFSVKSLEENNDLIEILYIGGLRPAKGVRDLVKAMQFLPAEYNLRIVGSGKLRSCIESLVEELDIATRVKIVGEVPYKKISAEYARADIFVHPGVWPEPGNRTTLEAMQAGLPVVCTNIGGPPELLPNQDLLCKPGNSKDIAQKIVRASENRDTIGTDNKSYVANKYTPQEIVSKFINLYDRII